MILLTLIVLVICVPAMCWFAIGIVYQTAKNDRQLTFNNTGEIKFVVRGGKFIKIIMDLPGKTYDAAKDEIIDLDSPVDRRRNWLAGWFYKLLAKQNKIGSNAESGIAWVSLIYPLVRMHTWDFHWQKLEANTEPGQNQVAVFKGYQIVEKHDPKVSSLFAEFTYPVIVRDIDLAENVTVTVLINVIVAVVKPLYLIAFLKGKFMAPANNEISGILDNGLRDKTIVTWRDGNRQEILNRVLPPGTPILKGALKIVSASYVEFDYSGNSQSFRDVLTARQEEIQKGEAEVAKSRLAAEAAEFKKKEKIALGEGEAAALKARLIAIHGSERGVELYLAEQQSLAIRGFRGGTLVMGGASAKVMVGEGKKPADEEKGDDPDSPDAPERQDSQPEKTPRSKKPQHPKQKS